MGSALDRSIVLADSQRGVDEDSAIATVIDIDSIGSSRAIDDDATGIEDFEWYDLVRS